MAGKHKISPDTFFQLFATLIAVITIIVVAITNTVDADSNISKLTFGCMNFPPAVLCNPMTNRFNSFITTGHVQHISTINSTKFDPVEGVFGNALMINGYAKKEYLTVLNKQSIDPAVFSVSFWIKQDRTSLFNSSVISHVNSEKTAGWYIQFGVRNSENRIQFSVTNTEGRVFSVSSRVDPGTFQNVVGVFDGKQVKIYLNGFLMESIAFSGDYGVHPNVPLNIGLNSYDYGGPWVGAIDEVRLYQRAISDSDIHRLADYSKYLQLSATSSNDAGLIGYWPLEGTMQDQSGDHNDGKIVLPTVSMVFSHDGKLFFSVRDSGEIRIMKPDFTVIREPFIRLQDPSTNTSQEILGITLDPEFSTNHYVYAYIVARDSKTDTTFNRVIRFTELENRATDQKTLVDNIPGGNPYEYAGALAFGPDNKLYITTAYVNQIDPHTDSGLAGKVLRIDRDGTIPSDNPFPNSPIYTQGHRNMFGIAFDKTTGIAIVAENDASHHDEINVLKKGGDYGFPATQPSPYSLVGSSQTDNSSALKPARTYYNVITPTQAVYYDGNKFPTLKGRFLVAAYGEGSIYSLSINKTGSVVEEVGIRLPEVRGHIISISKAPNGDLYIGGENLYKLGSIDSNANAPLTYFIDVTGRNVQINDLSLNLTNKVMSIDFENKNNNNSDGNIEAAVPSSSLQVRIPKVLLGGISLVTSEEHNKTSTAMNAIEDLKIKESRRVTNVGDTIIDIKLKSNISSDKILIKGQTSTLVQAPDRKTTIYR